MNITSIVTTAAVGSAAQIPTSVDMAVLKKAIDVETSGALALVQAVSAPPPVAPGEPGGIVDTWA